MPNIQEPTTPTFPESIHLIGLTEPVLGGPDGTSNIQAKQLAERTAYLKGVIEAHHDASNGSHYLTDADVSPDAAISESKLALTKTTADLQTDLQVVEQGITELENGEKDTSDILTRQEMFKLEIDTRNTLDDEKYFFDFFAPPFQMYDPFRLDGVSTVAGDDSLDVPTSTGIKVGLEYALVTPSGTELIEVAEVLSKTRIRTTADISYTSNNASLVRSTIDFNWKSTRVQANDVYYSKTVHLAAPGVRKHLIIDRKDSPHKLAFYWKDEDHATWQVAEKLDAFVSDPGMRIEVYSLGIGEHVEVKIVANAQVVNLQVNYLCFYSPFQSELRELVVTPSPVSPADMSTDVGETPTLELSAYKSLYGVPAEVAEFRVATDINFLNVVYTGTENPASATHTVAGGTLGVGSVYFWQGRYKDSDGIWSDWSESSSFSTASTFEYIAQPTAVSPSAGATDVGASPVLTASPFTVVNTTDTHASSQWQVATDSAFTDIIWDTGTDTTNLESVSLDGAGLDTLTQYYWRVRYNGTVLGWSAWSVGAGFVTKQAFANVAGVALITPGGDGGTWAYIDDDGNTVADPGTSYFDSHPAWGGIQDVTIDGQAMVRIPKFYIKREIIASGANAGKEGWWISDQPVDGYVVHPAFKVSGSEVDQIYVGKYQASMDGSKLSSVPGVKPAVSRSLTQFIADAQSRNVGGVSGFMLWSVYQWAAIQWLYLVEHATMDSQTKTGQGCVNTSSAANVDASDVAQATYRGIVGLWGNVFQWMDGLKTAGGSIHMWDREGNKSWVNTGKRRTAAAGNIYPTTFMDHSAANYDFADVFIGDTGPTTNSNATAPDRQYFNEDNECFPYVGGTWSSGAVAGLWNVHCAYAASYSYTFIGARLAKV